jgi:hypothetical protein
LSRYPLYDENKKGLRLSQMDFLISNGGCDSCI